MIQDFTFAFQQSPKAPLQPFGNLRATACAQYHYYRNFFNAETCAAYFGGNESSVATRSET